MVKPIIVRSTALCKNHAIWSSPKHGRKTSRPNHFQVTLKLEMVVCSICVTGNSKNL